MGHLQGRLGVLVLLLARMVKSAVVINEFVASNSKGLTDEEGDSPDWIELHNTATTPIDIGGWHLTDDITIPTLWSFPSGTSIGASSYLIVFASGKDRPGTPLHTNFKLGASGEYLGLYDASGSVVYEFSPEYPPQQTDRSYGLDGNNNLSYFDQPTPEAQNTAAGSAVSVEFSVSRGFYDAAFSVELTSQAGTGIRFTVDGSDPSDPAANVIMYSNPIPVSTTMVLRATTTGAPSPVTTHTYIFLDNVIRQPANVNGFPAGRLIETGPDTGEVPLDFAMDQTIVDGYIGEIRQAMKAIPTMVLSASLDDIYGDNGFYFGEDIERAVSMEVFHTDGSTDQQNAGAESHSHNRLKRALRLNFRSEYGNRIWPTRLFQSFPVGGDTAADRVRRVVLRSGNNRSWARAREADATSYTLDEFYRVTQQAMSGYSAHGNFVHLYINRVYEGVYNIVERPDDNFGEIYFGGSDDDWFFAKHTIDGSPKTSPRWDYLTKTLVKESIWDIVTQTFLGDDINYEELKQYVDVEAFVDYMLLNFYCGMTDWPRKNWYAVSREESSPLGPTPLKFVGWDGEHILDRRQDRSRQGATILRRFLWNTGYNEPIVRIWHALRRSPEFRALMENRANLHTSPGGALSASAAVERWDTINDFVRSAVIGESARWGDALRLLGGEFAVTRTRDEDWENQVTKVRALLESNTEQLLGELELLKQCDGLLPGFLCKFQGFFWRFVESTSLMPGFYR